MKKYLSHIITIILILLIVGFYLAVAYYPLYVLLAVLTASTVCIYFAIHQFVLIFMGDK